MIEKETGNRVPAVELKTRLLKDMHTGESIQECVSVPLEKFMQWQKDKAEDKRLRQANEQNDLLAAQVQKVVEARATLEASPSIPQLENQQGREELDADKLLHAVGFARSQQVYIPRPKDGVYAQGKILDAKVDGKGMIRIGVRWLELDPETNELIGKTKSMTPVELAEAQKQVLEGNVLVRGSGQVVEGI